MLPPITPQRIKLLDSDVLIDVQRGFPPAVAWYNAATATTPGTLALPGHALMELYQDAQNMTHTILVDRLTFTLPVIWPNDLECLEAVRNFRLLHLSQGVGLIDTLIAATALSLNAPLCTFNRKHFRHIPGRVIEQPYTR